MGNYSNIPTAERTNGWRERLDPDVESAKRRLDFLLELNAVDPELTSRCDPPETASYRNPVDTEKACSVLGLALGIVPPVSFFARLMIEDSSSGGTWAILLFSALVVLGSSVTGYFVGKVVGRALAFLELSSWPEMILWLPFVGILWGFIAGAAGGIFLLIFGAIPGAIIGGTVGAFALPFFGIIHRFLNTNGLIERDHLLPVAFGISALAGGLILGFPGF